MTNKGGRNIPALVFCFLYCYHTFIEQIGICASGVEYKIILDTERLFLREMKQNDFQDLAEILQNPRVMYAYEHDFSDNDVQEWLDRQIKKMNLSHNIITVKCFISSILFINNLITSNLSTC